jgi:hypothetical protein
MGGIEKIIHNCMPPEAYMRLWNSAAKNSIGPRYASTVIVEKKIDSLMQNNNIVLRSEKERDTIDK